MRKPKTLSLILAVCYIALTVYVVMKWTRSEAHQERPTVRAFYYWRSEWRFSAEERALLVAHPVERFYLHLFDVVRRGEQVMPDNTVHFVDSLMPAKEIVPTVYIAHDVFTDTTHIRQLPVQIATRLKEMARIHRLPLLQEVQIDCDWTRATETAYFSFLQRLGCLLKADGIPHLSVTIRLHQLTMKVPPADSGVLMVYNVGSLTDAHEPCSILTEEAIRPYLHGLKDYSLPLTAALPLFSWDLLFRHDKFVSILHDTPLHDTTLFQPLDSTHYLALRYKPTPPSPVALTSGGSICIGDVVRHEEVSLATLLAVKQTLASLRPSLFDRPVLYHFGNHFIQRFHDEDLQRLYRPL